jgi:hypothetical protein
MLRVTLWHEPQYFQFFVQDPAADGSDVFDPRTTNLIESQRFVCGDGMLIVRVISEYTRIPITVEFDRDVPPAIDLDQWDRVIECSLDIRSSEIVFAGCPDGPVHGRFGALAVHPGRYRLRVCYGGQNTVQSDGETGDHYLIQIWPSKEATSKVLKGASSS